MVFQQISMAENLERTLRGFPLPGRVRRRGYVRYAEEQGVY